MIWCSRIPILYPQVVSHMVIPEVFILTIFADPLVIADRIICSLKYTDNIYTIQVFLIAK